MKIKPLLYIIFLCTAGIYAQRQAILKTPEDIAGYQKVPQEKMFIHYNTTLLFAGEYLYYRLYCFNGESNLLSEISKIAYVELIDEKKKVVFKQKVKLENGLGQGDFFIPVSVPSGNYKLMGYTQWMLNAQKDNFFLGDISILNPYQGDQKVFLVDNDLNNSQLNSINSSVNKKQSKSTISAQKSNGRIELRIDKQVFQKRSPVTLTLNQSGFTSEPGNYSISVRKKNAFKTAQPVTADSFSSLSTKNFKSQEKSISSSFFLPEMRGELIYGKLVPKEPDFMVSSIDIAVSVPGKIHDVKIASTNEQGVFVFNLDKTYKTDNIVLQVLGESRNNYKIELDEAPQFNFPDFNFYQFKITQEFKDEIIERSVYNQVENNFFSVKPDTIPEVKDDVSFYGTDRVVYNLDDYTRFPTVKETIVEVVDNVWIEKNELGESHFAVRGYYPTQSNNNLSTLLIVDGIVEQEHEQWIDYDARKIKNISFVRDRYFLGSKVFEGVLVFETFEGNYVENLHKDYLLNTTLSRPQSYKNYYTQQYSPSNNVYNRIPDFRNQLLWKPNVLIHNETVNIPFFTSDVNGVYEIVLEGFTNNGIPVSVKKYFEVR
ncbi:hypothetical protein U6A24_11700 [Aquimarina gracilis]|uniref:MG2 domain-containing protein n=1 Tax=Aquimarina gracilis TaxID=874422 RepID=A0ABU5ZW81_9FLAO|nr:hypothetical protein [Aquimarina gracilis]MEB3346130.1 hypothetical protein [Aquimarina gracilis]